MVKQIATLDRQLQTLSSLRQRLESYVWAYVERSELSRGGELIVPDVPPDSQDFVTYFLYVGKEGYCTYYASAMTVMCRMAGLPARYVEGFEAQPAADGFAYVTGKDAHAWTEVYFKGFGWVPFDPTPEQEKAPPSKAVQAAIENSNRKFREQCQKMGIDPDTGIRITE